MAMMAQVVGAVAWYNEKVILVFMIV